MTCKYIKDNGERCSMDAEPFCHHHEDTKQSELYHSEEPITFAETPTITSQSASNGIMMDASCENCNASLRRTERLSGHENYPSRMVFEAVVECDCDETVLGSTSALKENLPDGWVE